MKNLEMNDLDLKDLQQKMAKEWDKMESKRSQLLEEEKSVKARKREL
jgi:hypothetical protein